MQRTPLVGSQGKKWEDKIQQEKVRNWKKREDKQEETGREGKKREKREETGRNQKKQKKLKR